MATPKKSYPQLHQYLDRALAGESRIVVPHGDEKVLSVANKLRFELRRLADEYAVKSDPNFRKYFQLQRDYEVSARGNEVVLQCLNRRVDDVEPVEFSVKNADGTLTPVKPPVIKAETIEERIKGHEQDVLVNLRAIMQTGTSFLNRVTASIQVVEMSMDDAVAPDFRDRLKHLLPDAFKVFTELLEYDIAADEELKGKERAMLEGAKLKAVKFLAERTGESKKGLWPPDTTSPAWKRRMAKAREAAKCTTETPGRIFENPAVLLCFYDNELNSGKSRLHDWQIEEPSKFARPLRPGEIHRQCTAAANGAGKSKYLGAPAAIWGSMEHPAGVTVITTASGKQLDKQASKYIKALARQVNAYHEGQLWEIQHRSLKFEPLDSDIEMFATDEPGQAEGWHPKVDGGYFGILVDEAKTVLEDIFSALSRCNGCARRWDYSSPGQPSGHFYKTAVDGHWMFRRVTAYECPHITPAEIEEVIRTYGDNSPLTRSIIHAEFTSLDGNLVLTWEKINRCIKHGKPGPNGEAPVTQHRKSKKNRAGLDLALSQGGDESVFSVWNGNKMIGQEVFRESDIEAEVNKIIHFIHKWNLQDNPEDIVGDAGGLGRPVLQRLGHRGYKTTWFYAQSQPKTVAGKNFASRGTECWHKFARLVEESEIILVDDAALKNQLANRYYKQSAKEGKIVLEPKPEAKANGHPSPDRADAAVLANVLWTPESDMEQEQKRPGITPDELATKWEDKLFQKFEESTEVDGAWPTLQEVGA